MMMSLTLAFFPRRRASLARISAVQQRMGLRVDRGISRDHATCSGRNPAEGEELFVDERFDRAGVD